MLVLDLRHEFGSRYKLWLQNNLRASLVANLFSIIFPIFGHKWNRGKLFLEIIFSAYLISQRCISARDTHVVRVE